MANIRVLATDLEFPEGPVVMPDGSVVLVEIRGRRLTRVWPDGRKEVVAEIPGGPNGAALGPDGKMYICNNGGFSWIPARGILMPGPPSPAEYIGGSIQRVDLQSGKVETVIDKCGEHPLKGPNDLVFDKHGGLWFTDLGKRRARDMDVGAFYYLKPGMKEVVEGAFGMLPANGIGLSPDENTVYVAETPTARLWAFESVRARRGQAARSDLSRRTRQADRGPRRLPDVRLAGGRSLRQCLRRDADLGLHLGDRARRHAGRAGADRRPHHHQHRLRRARPEDRLHHAVGQGRTGRDGLGAARPGAEFFEQVTIANENAHRHCERSEANPSTPRAEDWIASSLRSSQ